MKPATLALCAAVVVSLVAGAAWRLNGTWPAVADDLAQRMKGRVDWGGVRPVPCPGRGEGLVLLVLGQSNAGNHGEAASTDAVPINLLSPAGCVQAQDPLPGATGRGGSLWTRLPHYLTAMGVQQPLLWRVLAVDASSLEEWTRPGSPLRDALQDVLADLRRQGRPPALVLWQQGEADARLGTTQAGYRAGLQQLADLLEAEGVSAPVLLARSTRCRSEPSGPIRAAVAAQIDADPRTRSGPDTDVLDGPALRYDGCHFSRAGLAAAAALWARVIAAALEAPPAAPAASAPNLAGPSRAQAR